MRSWKYLLLPKWAYMMQAVRCDWWADGMYDSPSIKSCSTNLSEIGQRNWDVRFVSWMYFEYFCLREKFVKYMKISKRIQIIFPFLCIDNYV